jgi:hypothetical protein
MADDIELGGDLELAIGRIRTGIGLLDQCFKPLLDYSDGNKQRAIQAVEAVEYQIASLKRDADELYRAAYDGIGDATADHGAAGK